MVVFVTGGSGCGKSAFAESVAQKLNQEDRMRRGENGSSKASGEDGLIYVATMPVFNEDDLIKVERHHKLRAGKGFETLERPKLLTEIPGGGETVLVECMSTHTANMLYDPDLVMEDDKDGEKALAAIRNEIEALCKRNGSTVFVSAEIALDGIEYDVEMEKYKRVLTAVNCFLMERADAAYEVVYGIPVALKGAKWEDGADAQVQLEHSPDVQGQPADRSGTQEQQVGSLDVQDQLTDRSGVHAQQSPASEVAGITSATGMPGGEPS